MDAHACAQLSSRSDFPAYIKLLRNATDNDFSLVSSCRLNVCGALWGSGNPDISGIGMATGYLLESVLCSLIVGASLWYDTTGQKDVTIANLLLSTALGVYYDTASFFTFAIQLACIATLAKADWGMGADGMGGITKEITWLVSSLSLLPLVIIVLRPHLYKEIEPAKTSGQSTHDRHTGASPLETGKSSTVHGGSHEAAALVEARQEQRLFFFVVCWALAFSPFYSLMGGTFGESRIGDSPNAVISGAEWAVIEQTCFKGVKVIGLSQKHLITAIGIVSYLLTTLVVLHKIFASAMEGLQKGIWAWVNKLEALFDEDSTLGLLLWLAMYIIVALLVVVEFWAFFRLRQLQSDMVEVAGGSFPDGQWSFGQFVAIAVFLPVFTESVFVWWKRSLYLVSGHDGVEHIGFR